MRNLVSLYLRFRSDSGKWEYVKPVRLANRRLKTLCGIVDGVPQHCPEGSYALRYWIDGKRVWESVGSEPDAATSAKQRKEAELQATAQVIHVVTAPVPPTTENIPPPEPKPKPEGRSIEAAIDQYLLEISTQKSRKTFLAYVKALELFQNSRKYASLKPCPALEARTSRKSRLTTRILRTSTARIFFVSSRS